jgi:hypothetical protein
MRQTGRTTRIANYAIDQLLSCGNVIVTDHFVFESDSPGKSQEHLIDKVYEIWHKLYAPLNWYKNTELNVKMYPLHGFPKHIRVIHFNLKHKHGFIA